MATNERDEASFQDFLTQQIAAKDAEINDLKAQIEQLKKQKGISSVREGLTFNSHTGIWSDSAGSHFCPTCLNDEKRNPLKTESRGWRCTAAAHYFGNPDAPPPKVVRGDRW